MRVRCHAQGKFYAIECPEGTEVVRRSGSNDQLIVPFRTYDLRGGDWIGD